MIGKIHPIPAFTDNYIWAIHCSESDHVCIVDPGDANVVQEYLNLNKLQLTDILVTHHHPDHTGGLMQLKKDHKPRIIGPKSSGIDGITDFVTENDSIELFDCNFTVIEVPGHTLDHLAFYSKSPLEPLLFCGDTLFAAGCGRLFEGTAEMMTTSLDKLADLPEDTSVYCTHEYTLANLTFAKAVDPQNAALGFRTISEQHKRKLGLPTLPSTISHELRTNPFLRCDDDVLKKSVETNAGRKLKSRLDTFTELRLWKDGF
jgi:hydroxyacylglutathione hydrolase